VQRRPLAEERPIGRHRRDPAQFIGPERNVKLERLQRVGEWLGLILLALLGALLVKVFVVQVYFIPSGSMIPTMKENDRIVVSKLNYRLGAPSRRDIVVFDTPVVQEDSKIDILVKRVIGLPGDRVESRDGVLYVNGEAVDEPYLAPDTVTDLANCGRAESITVPKGFMFVMGDNRTRSADSRCFGVVDQDLLIGGAFLKIWPLNEFGRL